MTEPDCPCGLTRRQVPPPPRPPDCQCGHGRNLHFINPKGQHTTCSSWHGGRCRCTGYTTKDE